MVFCSVLKCNSNSKKDSKDKSNITFCRFPTDVERKIKWTQSVGRQNWVPTKWNFVCSLHFKESDFYTTDKGYRRLHNDAVPTLNLPKWIQEIDPLLIQSPIDQPNHESRSSTSSSNCSMITSSQTQSDELRPSTFSSNNSVNALNFSSDINEHEFEVDDTPREKKLKSTIKRLRFICEQRKKTINRLAHQNSRKEKKINKLQNVISLLQGKIKQTYFQKATAR